MLASFSNFGTALAKQDYYAKGWWKCSHRLDNLYDKQLFAKETLRLSDASKFCKLCFWCSKSSAFDDCKIVSINNCESKNFSLLIYRYASSFSLFDVCKTPERAFSEVYFRTRMMQTIGFTCVLFIQVIQWRLMCPCRDLGGRSESRTRFRGSGYFFWVWSILLIKSWDF